MSRVECAREQDVLEALAAGRWPARCDAELQQHVAGCRICADLAEVAGRLLAYHNDTWDEIQVPSAGTVWWRAQLRARQEASRKASRPITVAHAAATIVTFLGIIALLYISAPWVASWVATLNAPEWLSVQLPDVNLPTIESLPSLESLGMWRWVGLAAFVTWAIIAPLAIYFAAGRD